MVWWESARAPLHIFLSRREVLEILLVDAEDGQVVLDLVGEPVLQYVDDFFAP